MKQSHKKVLDALARGCFLRRDRLSVHGVYLVKNPASGKYASEFTVRSATIDEMRRLNLLVLKEGKLVAQEFPRDP